MRQTFIIAVALCALLLGACGQMGPLYPPGETDPGIRQQDNP